MTKVAIFGSNDPVKFKNEINDFIKDKKIIDIKYNTIFFKAQYSKELWLFMKSNKKTPITPSNFTCNAFLQKGSII